MANRFRILQEAEPRDPIAVVAAAGPRSSGRRRANNGAGSSGTPSPESSGKASFYSTEQPTSSPHQSGRRRENPDSPPHHPEAGPSRRRENPDSPPHHPEAGPSRRRENPPSPLSQPDRGTLLWGILWVPPANRANHLYMAMFILTSVYTIYAYAKDALTTEGALAERLSAFGSLAYTSGFISVVMTTFDIGSDLVLHLATISAVMGLFGLTVTTLLGVGGFSDSAQKMLIRVGILDAALLMGIEYRRGLNRIFAKREQHHGGVPHGRGGSDVEMGSVSSRAGDSE